MGISESHKAEIEVLLLELDQRRKFERLRYFEPTSAPNNPQDLFLDSPAKIRCAFGGNRCLGGETKIYDPVKGVSLRVDEIDSDFHVYAWDGKKIVITNAERPFTKEVDDLYRIELSTGEEFVASLSHLVVAGGGFQPLSRLPVGFEVFHPQSNKVKIIRKTFVRRDVKWDFTVPIFHNYLCGGIIHHNSGKTEVGAVDCILACLGKHPSRATNPPLYGRVCAPKYEDGCKGVILKKFQQLIPRKDLQGGSWDVAWKESSKTLSFANSSRINFKSGEQDLNTYGGDDLDFFWIDEHLQEKYFLENMARITDRNGWGLLTMTPEAGQTWEWDFVTGPPPGVTVDYWFFSTEKNPYLSKEGVETFKATITDPRLREAKLYGRFVALTGMVYPQYDKAKLICSDFEIPRKWPRTLIIDPHLKKPSALLWMAWDDDRPVIYRAEKVKLPVVASDGKESLVTYIRAKSAGERIDLYLADEAMGGKGKNIYGEESVIEQLVQAGLPFMGTNQSSDKAFEAGVSKVIDYITQDPITGIVPMKIFQSCDWGVRHLEGKRAGSIFWEFERYRFKKEQKSQEETYSEHVASVDDDLLDCLRYGIMAGQPTGGQSVTVESSVSGSKFVDSLTGW